MFAARQNFLKTKGDALKRMLLALKEAIDIFHSTPDMANQIAKAYGLTEDDAREWYKAVKISGEPVVTVENLSLVLDALLKSEVCFLICSANIWQVITAEEKETDLHNIVDGSIGTLI